MLLVTVTEQGKAESIVVLSGFDDGINRRTVEQIKTWTFKPAIGPDGKPFAVRVPVEMTYRLTR